MIARCSIVLMAVVSVQYFTNTIYELVALIMIKAHMISKLIQIYTREFVNGIKSGRRHIMENKAFRAIILHREIQQILFRFRMLYSNDVLISIAFGAMGVQVLGIYVVVNATRSETQDDDKFQIFFYGWMVIVNMLTVLFVFGKMGAILHQSKVGEKEIKQQTMVMRRTRFMRYFRSCQRLKVNIGPDNFVEPVTPINMESYVILETISLLFL